MKTANIIEQRDVERDYGFDGVDAIIDHPKHGRLWIEDGFGGGSVEGQCVRWKHGMIIKLAPDETFESLGMDGWYAEAHERLVHQHEVMEWNGYVVASIAKSAGLV